MRISGNYLTLQKKSLLIIYNDVLRCYFLFENEFCPINIHYSSHYVRHWNAYEEAGWKGEFIHLSYVFLLILMSVIWYDNWQVKGWRSMCRIEYANKQDKSLQL